MARIVGGIATSHIPSIGNAIAKGLQQDPYWQPFFAGFAPVRAWLSGIKPDLAVVVYNDHGLNFFLDKMPTFAVGAAEIYHHADEGWGLPVSPPFAGDTAFSWHLIESLIAAEFDIVSCQEMLVDHALTVPMTLLWPEFTTGPAAIVPVVVNTVQHPLPSPKRCLALGRAIGQAVESYDRDLRVVMIGTGGMSHQLEGTRAGFINREFDLFCLEKIVAAPDVFAGYSIPQLVELAGSQGVELLNWLVMRGALTGKVTQIHRNYHVPISNTATGLLALENAAIAAKRSSLATV
jgi:protocatechuate 4,5-dioxygenase beta chain